MKLIQRTAYYNADANYDLKVELEYFRNYLLVSVELLDKQGEEIKLKFAELPIDTDLSVAEECGLEVGVELLDAEYEKPTGGN